MRRENNRRSLKLLRIKIKTITKIVFILRSLQFCICSFNDRHRTIKNAIENLMFWHYEIYIFFSFINQGKYIV